METAGYSGTPLSRKLGFKAGYKIRLVNQPDYYFDLFVDLTERLEFTDSDVETCNIIHYFATDFEELRQVLPSLRGNIEQQGAIWISWPKKASKIKSNISEDLIRNLALVSGLVDVKVCAVDGVWSGLKLAIPIKERNK
jgi:hypothetical protein